MFKTTKNKILALAVMASTSTLFAAPLEVPASTVSDLETSASNFGGSALLVWGAVALAAIGIAVFKRIFK